MHDRGSHGCKGSVAPLGADRFGLFDNGVLVVVDDGVSPPPADDVDGVDDDRGTVVAVAGEAFTAKFDPVTSTTSAVWDEGSGAPTSIVVGLEIEFGPPAVAVKLVSPGS